MEGRVEEIRIELKNSCSDTMLNYQLSQKYKLLWLPRMAPTANYENDQQQQPICQKPQPTTIGSNTKLKTKYKIEKRKQEREKNTRDYVVWPIA